jgi:hypothetical protein
MRNRILTTLFLLITSFSFACDCEWGGNFIYSSKFSELIIKGKVIEKLYNFEDHKVISESNKAEFEDYIFKKNQEFYKSIKVEIIELIRGKEKRRIIEIFGTNGSDCRSGIDDFKKGGIYIFSMFKTVKSEYNQPNENETNYHIDGCSENTLEFIPETNEVFGVIKGKSSCRKNRKYSYEKLKRKI